VTITSCRRGGATSSKHIPFDLSKSFAVKVMPVTRLSEGRSNAFAALLARNGIHHHNSTPLPNTSSQQNRKSSDDSDCSSGKKSMRSVGGDISRLSIMKQTIDRKDDSNMKRMLHLQAEEIEVLTEKLRLKDEALEVAKQSLNCVIDKSAQPIVESTPTPALHDGSRISVIAKSRNDTTEVSFVSSRLAGIETSTDAASPIASPGNTDTAVEEAPASASAPSGGDNNSQKDEDKNVTNTVKITESQQLTVLQEFQQEALRELQMIQHAHEASRKHTQERYKTVVAECDRVLDYVKAIEGHTLHGRHVCASALIMCLLMKTRQALECLRTTFASSAIMSDVNASDELRSPSRTITTAVAATAAVSISHGHDSKNDSFDASLVDTCKRLESEKAVLLETIDRLNAEAKDNAALIAQGKLIPQYRSAVMGAREKVSLIQDLLEEEKVSACDICVVVYVWLIVQKMAMLCSAN
jgi:hypothetical protein